MPFLAVTELAFKRLVNDQYALLQRSIAAQERLQRIVLSERGLDAIVGALATIVGGAALVFDGRGEPRAQRAFRRVVAAEVVDGLSSELRDRARRGERRGFVPATGDLAPRALALPVAPPDAPERGLPQAWLVAIKDQGGLSEFDRLILNQAVTVIALELMRRRVAETTERRLAGDVLTEVDPRRRSATPELRRRLEPFGLGEQVSAPCLRPRRPAPGRLRGRARRGAARGGGQRARGALRLARVRARAGHARRRAARAGQARAGAGGRRA